MKVTEADFGGAQPIDGYGPGYFLLGARRHEGPLLMSAAGPATWDGLPETDALVALKPETDVLLIGTGGEIAQLPAEMSATLDAADLAYEIMPTPSACRTYNVLLAERRRVAAALMPVF